MKSQRTIAAIAAAASLLSSTGAAFAQAERNQELLDQRQRDQQRGFPNGDPRSGDARTPAVIDRGGNLHEVRPTPRGGAVVGPALPGNYRPGDRTDAPADRYGYRNDGRGDRGYARGDSGYYRQDEWRHDGRGAGPEHSFYRGGRLPPQYRSRHYVVEDWRSHHLYAPPRGYQWVQTGGDYVLVAVATGIIAAILLNQ
jgi:Ni/Co efflux regulator RcnB